MSRSEQFSKSLYAQLGVRGLANRTAPEWDEQIVRALIELLPRRARILDAGCRYGRISLSLAREGYDVEGIDVSENLIEAARTASAASSLSISFTVGTMTQLPYSGEAFDVVICLWSAFHELLDEREQTQALAETWRVLRPEGFTLIEGPLYREPSEDEIESGVRRGPEFRLVWGEVEGILNPHYLHDERSFRRICAEAGVTKCDVFEREWAGRQRLFLRIDKVT